MFSIAKKSFDFADFSVNSYQNKKTEISSSKAIFGNNRVAKASGEYNSLVPLSCYVFLLSRSTNLGFFCYSILYYSVSLKRFTIDFFAVNL